MVTIKDVAKEAGVAISTVSNVLNQVDIVSEPTKRRVLDAVEKLKYVPNMYAKFLKSNKRNTIGLFLPSIQGDYYRLLMQAVHVQCIRKCYLLNIYVTNENTSEEIYSMMISSGVDGAIVLNDRLHDKYVDIIAQTEMPIVFIDREYKGDRMSSVIVNNEEGVILALEYLMKQGHRRIGYMHGVNNYDNKERFKAYENVMRKYSLPLDKNLILKGYYEEAPAYCEILRMLKKGIELPDAIFCANDDMAAGCIRAFQKAGVKVPEQVSVIGFDDIAPAGYYSVAPTTIHSPVTEIGTVSTLELFELMGQAGPVQGKIIRLNPRLIVRNTCEIRI